MAGSLRKLLVCWTFGLATSAVLPLSADDMAAPHAAKRVGPVAAIVLPGTNYELRMGNLPIRRTPDHSERALLEAIGAWLVSEFVLPSMDYPPALVFASPRTMISLRSAGMSLDRGGSDRAEIVAVYHDQSRTIYLPAGWTGSTPAELSVLVHEMVHHLQNSAGAKFECPEAREKMAYEAQARWLAMSGSDLAAAFGIDPMTLLVRTSCFR